MKIYIDWHGTLCIERAGKPKGQLCPYGSADLIHCGDWCSLFGEPVVGPGGMLTICQGRVLYGTIVDERPKEGEKP
jgi:hypothetical protein